MSELCRYLWNVALMTVSMVVVTLVLVSLLRKVCSVLSVLYLYCTMYKFNKGNRRNWSVSPSTLCNKSIFFSLWLLSCVKF